MLVLKSRLGVAGLVVMLVAGFFHFVMFIQDISGGSANPYLQLYYLVLLPALFFAGLFIALIGRVRARRRLLASRDPERMAKGLKWTVTTATVALVSLAAILGFTSYTSYSVFHHSESVDFCGSSCHEPMGPTLTAYKESPHRAISCTRCHVGDGPRGFLEAKLSGTRQLIETIADSYSRPIIAPRDKLNVPHESCTSCHVPGTSAHFRLEHRVRVASAAENTFRPLFMALKTAGGADRLINPKGYHWHHAEIAYASADDKGWTIPWVRARRGGTEKVYRSDGEPAGATPPGAVHAMECVDCHNRVGHHYRGPDEVVSELFRTGKLDYTLPDLKRVATQLLAETYDSGAAAKAAISSGLRRHYEEKHASVAAARASDIAAQSEILAAAYETHSFPQMKADWRNYPDHSGHKYSAGCFRCHDGRHQASDGSVISQDCTLCHTFYQEETAGGVKKLIEGKYRHPLDLSKAGHDRLLCSACHWGGPTPPNDCTGCHDELARLGRAGPIPSATGK